MRLLADENFPKDVSLALRQLGHDVLTALEAERANQGIVDEEVLRFAHMERRAVLTGDRIDYLRLHRGGLPHSGILIHTFDRDVAALSARIHAALADGRATGRFLVRVHLQGFSFDA